MMTSLWFRPGLGLLLVFWLCFTIGCSPLTLTLGGDPQRQELEPKVVRAADARTDDAVAIIDVSGVIVNARPPRLLGRSENPVSLLVEQLEAARRHDDVRAIILRINSPGGGVTATDMMYREVQRFRARTRKPVVVLCMDVAASGGYYLALSGDRLLAYPTTVTGSIGVLAQSISFKPALERIGVEPTTLVSGPNKAAGSPLTTLDEDQRATLQTMVDEMYDRFASLVRQRRPGMSPEQLATATDGRVVTGDRAAELGLIDRVGDLHDAHVAAMELAGLDAAHLVRFHRPLQYVGSPYAATPVDGGANAAGAEINLFQLRLDGAGLVTGPGLYYLWQPSP